MSNLEPDRDQIEIFTDAMFRHAGAGFVSLRSFYDEDDNESFKITPANMDGRHLRVLNDLASADARTAAEAIRKVVFCPPVCTFKARRGATEADIKEGVALSVDCDRNPTFAREKLVEVLGPPTCVVASGGTWTDPETGEVQDKVHLHWRLQRPASGDRLVALKRARLLALRLVDGDPTTAPVCHPLRWPGSWHRKAEPRMTKIIEVNPDVEIDLAEALKLLEEVAPPEEKSRTANAGGQSDYGELMGNILAGNNLHDSITRLAAKMIAAKTHPGAVTSQLRTLMDHSAAARDERWQSRFNDIPRAVWSAEQKYGKPEADIRIELTSTLQPEPEAGLPPPKAWPTLGKEAKHGVAWAIAHYGSEESEADPVAILVSTIVYASAMFGRDTYFRIGDGYHHSRHFASLVGQSSRGRKGTSFGPVDRVFRTAENYLHHRVLSDRIPDPPPPTYDLNAIPMQVSGGPLSSGEGILWAIRDPEGDDAGVKDKRLLVVEEEFGNALRQFQRTGNNLSMILRGAWDGKTLAPLTKTSRVRVTRPHISLLGHITRHELTSLLAQTEIWNGLANRVLWFLVRRSKTVPFPQPMDARTVEDLAKMLAEAIRKASGQEREIRFSNAAQDLWISAYPDLTLDHAGVLGQVTARQEAQVMRLAVTYALLDGADMVGVQHLEAALALAQYAMDSAAYLFGDRDSDPVAQTIIEALRDGPKTQTEVSAIFGRHKTAAEISAVLTDLQERGRIQLDVDKKGKGRAVNRWRLIR